MQLAAPIVSPVVSESSSYVRVRGQLTNSYVEVFEVTGSETFVVARGQTAGPDQFFRLERTLTVPGRLFARQSWEGDSSLPDPEAVWSQIQPAPRDPRELGIPRLAGHARSCSRCVWIDRAFPGGRVPCQGGSDLLGSSHAHDGLAVVGLNKRAAAALETLEVGGDGVRDRWAVERRGPRAHRTDAAHGHRGPGRRRHGGRCGATVPCPARETGIELGADQAAAVRGVLTSGARIECLVGPPAPASAATKWGLMFLLGVASGESWAFIKRLAGRMQ